MQATMEDCTALTTKNTIMLNWLRNLFGGKPEEPAEINVNQTVHDLKRGYILDYDMESWEVVGSYTYRYKTHVAKEYKIRSGSKTLFLNVSDANSLLLSLSGETNINEVDARLRTSIASEQPIVRFDWKGETYTLKETSRGQFTDNRLQDWADFVGYEYVDKDNARFVYISKWEDGSIECYTGKYLKEFEISNILPGK